MARTAGRIRHKIDGEAVIEYTMPQIGGGNVSGHDPKQKVGGKLLDGGTISLHSESHPIEFRKVELLNLAGCMDPKAKNQGCRYRCEASARCLPDLVRTG